MGFHNEDAASRWRRGRSLSTKTSHRFGPRLEMMDVSRFPPSEVAAKIVVSLGIGLLVGIEREWSNKDLGARTFALTALLGTIAALFEPSMLIVSMVGVF